MYDNRMRPSVCPFMGSLCYILLRHWTDPSDSMNCLFSHRPLPGTFGGVKSIWPSICPLYFFSLKTLLSDLLTLVVLARAHNLAPTQGPWGRIKSSVFVLGFRYFMVFIFGDNC